MTQPTGKGPIAPNFFIVGAPKCGTTSLAANLAQHPEVFMPSVKEPFYFVRGVRCEDFDEYIALFQGAGGAKAVGEASTGYLVDEDAARRIKEAFPDARIIIILRNPVDMAYSHWRHVTISGYETKPFEEAISDGERAYRKTAEFKGSVFWWPNFLHLEKALYSAQVKRYLDAFGRERVKVLIFEDFVRDQRRHYQELFSFLGVEPSFVPDFRVRNEGGQVRFSALNRVRDRKYPLLRRLVPVRGRVFLRETFRRLNTKTGKSEMAPATRRRLEEFFKEDIAGLERLLGREIAAWTGER